MANTPRRLFSADEEIPVGGDAVKRDDTAAATATATEAASEVTVKMNDTVAKLFTTVKPAPVDEISQLQLGPAASKRKRTQRKSPTEVPVPAPGATVAPPPAEVKREVSTKYIIRPMTMKDCAACFHLGEEVFTSDFPNLYRFWDEYEVIDCYSGDPELCFVAETDNAEKRVFAFVLANIIKKSDHTRFGYVHWIAVNPAFRRRRIGTHLYDKVYKIMVEKGVKMILADTPNENESAKSFFVYHGFGDPIQHVFMSLNLSHSETDRSDEEYSPSTAAVTRKRARGRADTPSSSSSTAVESTALTAPAHHHHHHHPAPKGKKRPGNPQIVVRAMGIDDMHAVYELGDKVFGDNKKPNMFRFWEPSGVLDLFETDSETCLVAELGNEIVGFCLGTTIVKKRSAWKYGYIIWLGISPNHQGLGIGSRLFQHFHKLMIEENVRMLLIDTQADVPAVKFWEKQRFGHAQEHVFYSKKMDGVSDDFMTSESSLAGPSSTPPNQTNLMTASYEMAPAKEPPIMTDPSVVGLRRRGGPSKAGKKKSTPPPTRSSSRRPVSTKSK